MMDRDLASEPFPIRKLNARAPEFVPRSAAAAAVPPPPPPPHVFQHVLRRPPFYGYEFFPHNAVQFLPYNVNHPPLSPAAAAEMKRDVDNGAVSPVGVAAAASPKNEMSDAHKKILNQVEFYFSDINLATTDQLYTIMSKDPEGYVPISVVASFKKIKSAVNGAKELAHILRNSKKLSVSKDGKRVKRLNPFTESDLQELQSRIVVAENLPEDRSHQNLMKLFSSVGSVKSIRTCPPQKPSDDSSSASKTRGDPSHFSSKFHAYVEYESVEEAEKAVFEIKNGSNWRNGLKVRLLLRSAVRTAFFEDVGKPTEARAKKVSHEGEPNGRKDEANVPEMHRLKENHSGDMPQYESHFHPYPWENNGSNNSQRKGFANYGGRANGKLKGRGQGQGRGWVQQSTNGGSVLGSAIPENSGSTEKLTGSKTSGIPRMPDGTKGFSMGRGKPIAIKSA